MKFPARKFVRPTLGFLGTFLIGCGGSGSVDTASMSTPEKAATSGTTPDAEKKVSPVPVTDPHIVVEPVKPEPK